MPETKQQTLHLNDRQMRVLGSVHGQLNHATDRGAALGWALCPCELAVAIRAGAEASVTSFDPAEVRFDAWTGGVH